MFANIYHNRRVLITGHTGFKGCWLALWLESLNAHVSGLSQNIPTEPNHWDLLKLNCFDSRGDIRELYTVQKAINHYKPEIVFHLAAQSLVRRSYASPLETWSTNVIGTANVLEACRSSNSVKAVIIVTTDKCYENREQIWGYRESETLGGHDPYSASKAAAELVSSSFRSSFYSVDGAALIATARAGNVIGGGDWSEDRLVPDAARSVLHGKPLKIRSPNATRPWQHVLEPLCGYLLLGQQLLEGNKKAATAWNFGPSLESNQSVQRVLKLLHQSWRTLNWQIDQNPQPHETELLHVDSTKAIKQLKWTPVWSFEEGLRHTASWYQTYFESGTSIARQQLEVFNATAISQKRHWALQQNGVDE